MEEHYYNDTYMEFSEESDKWKRTSISPLVQQGQYDGFIAVLPIFPVALVPLPSP